MTTNRERLQELVDDVHTLLETRKQYFTAGAKLALNDVLNDAELALHGQYRPPFVRNRAFYTPRDEEGVCFATKRFTMAPTYLLEGRVYGEYGLEPALQWFEHQDMLSIGHDKLVEKARFVLETGEKILASATLGHQVGDYDSSAAVALRDAIGDVRRELGRTTDSDLKQLACTVVRCFDALRDFRHSRVLRTDLERDSILYLTEKEVEHIRESIKFDPLIADQHKQIVALSEKYTLDYIDKALTLIMTDKADYSLINKDFYVWSSTDKIVNFTAPENAVKGKLSFVLPRRENEQSGLGHVWIDDLKILSAQLGEVKILNSGFDEGLSAPAHWHGCAFSGEPTMRWESEYPFCGGGDRYGVEGPNPSSQVAPSSHQGESRRSLYICNQTGNDEGGWVYDEDFPVQGGTGYTLTFAAKIDGKFRKGIKVVISYFDDADQVIDSYEYYFNRRSSLSNNCFQLTMQCDAIQYLLTYETNYAVKAKKEILYTLNDFCQGAEHWLVTNFRPQGSDSYGAVQGGRLLCNIAVTYSLIRSANVFSDNEKQWFYAMVEYMLRYMLDLRDRTELPPEKAQQGCSNWQTDMCAGAAYLMLVLDDFPNRKTWLYNAHHVLKAQLELNVNPDNSWPESIRYHYAALERFAGYAKVVEQNMGENWFETTPIRRMFGFGMFVQTPGYRFFDGRIGTPPFGDHVLNGGSEFASYATYLGEVEKVDKLLADQMYHTWVRAGKPMKAFWGEAIALHNLLSKAGAYQPSTKFLSMGSTKEFKDAGIYVFRKSFGSNQESYFAVMSSPKPIGHGHLDQGSFIIYKNSIPIVMDSGIEGYFDSSTSWHISSYSHACVQFASSRGRVNPERIASINLSAGSFSMERGWVDVPRVSRVLDCRVGGEVERISIEINNPEGAGRHIRQIYNLKEQDVYIIRDTIMDFDGEVMFNLPVVSRSSWFQGNRVYSEGFYDVDLETIFLDKVNDVKIDRGRTAPFFEANPEHGCMMDYIRATANATEGFLTVVYPLEHGQPRIGIHITGDRTIRMSTSHQEFEFDLKTMSYIG